MRSNAGPHRRAATKRNTIGLLTSLGNTADAVAASLEAAGVRGVSANPRGCAVAVYLGAVIGADPQVRSVKVGRAEVVITPKRWWGRSIVVPIPPPAREFVVAFDAGRFPKLLRTASQPGCSADISTDVVRPTAE
jgi:hypothetical protein